MVIPMLKSNNGMNRPMMMSETPLSIMNFFIKFIYLIFFNQLITALTAFIIHSKPNRGMNRRTIIK
jgi:hypothetical protein